MPDERSAHRRNCKSMHAELSIMHVVMRSLRSQHGAQRSSRGRVGEDALASMHAARGCVCGGMHAEACTKSRAPPLQCALRPALLRSHVLRRQGHTDTKFQFCEASRYDLRECFGNRTRSREKLCFGNIAQSREKSCATGWRTNSNRRVFGHMTVRRSAGICDLKNRNHTLWGSPPRPMRGPPDALRTPRDLCLPLAKFREPRLS